MKKVIHKLGDDRECKHCINFYCVFHRKFLLLSDSINWCWDECKAYEKKEDVKKVKGGK